MKNLTILFCVLLFTSFVQKEQLEPIKIEPKKGEVFRIEGNLSQGELMPDLSWAWNSSVACFPATQSHKFTGNHVLYEFMLPAYSEVEITVIPANRKDNFSLYAYEIGATRESIVPDLPSCVRCEADYKWDRPHRGKTQNHTRTVRNILALRNPYKVIVGVAGADGLTEGDYTLEIRFVK